MDDILYGFPSGSLSTFVESYLRDTTCTGTGYPPLSVKAVNVLLPFATTYLCETASAAVTVIKSTYRVKQTGR